MSKIIRCIRSAPAVPIGEQQVDRERLAEAERALGKLLPMVNVITDQAGMKLIPVTEVSKIKRAFVQEVGDAEKLSHQRGYDEGHAVGLDEGLKRAREVTGQFAAAVRDAVDQRRTLLEEARQQVLDLVMRISRKVTYDAIEADPEIVAGMIRGVIDDLVDPSRLKIKVNPNHLPIIEQNISEFLKGSSAIKEITIEPDPRVANGGCFIETPGGDIDARIDSQFEIIAEQLESSEDVKP